MSKTSFRWALVLAIIAGALVGVVYSGCPEGQEQYMYATGGGICVEAQR